MTCYKQTFPERLKLLRKIQCRAEVAFFFWLDYDGDLQNDGFYEAYRARRGCWYRLTLRSHCILKTQLSDRKAPAPWEVQA